MKSYLLYALGMLTVLVCICQDDILVFFKSASADEHKPATMTTVTADVAVVNANTVQTTTEATLAYDCALPEPVETAEKITIKKAIISNNDNTVIKMPKNTFDRSQTVRLNGMVYQSLEDKLIACIAYLENYFPNSYFCGARWTIGYGTTGYTNGRRVASNESISKEEAQTCVRHHLRSYVFPIIDKYVERELSEEEMLATCLFIYNIGGGNFADKKGSGRPCAFLQALNDNESPRESARKMTEFYRSAGKKADGLLKRRWIEGAIFCGYLTVDDILQLEPAGFYNSSSLNDYYMSSHPDRDGFYSYRFDQDTLNRFLNENQGTNKRVVDII